MREFVRRHDVFSWAEELPDACPPDLAAVPEGEIFYRLVSALPPAVEDFLSQRALDPDRCFHADECIAHAVSVFDSAENCNIVRKFPAQRSKKMVCLPLSPNSGVILRTGRNQGHYSWWRDGRFDVLALCVPVEA